jgi:hypothetical protein
VIAFTHGTKGYIPLAWNTYVLAAAVFLLLQGFTDVQTATGSSCVANGASTENRNSSGGGSGSPTPAPSPVPTPSNTGCQVANCAACRGAPTNCYLCKPVRSWRRLTSECHLYCADIQL